MKRVDKIEDDKIYVELAKIIRIGNKGIKLAKEENEKFGIPDTFCKKGILYYVLENGEITKTPPPIMRR